MLIAFDLLYLKGRDLTQRPLRNRRPRLEDLDADSDRIHAVRRLAPNGLDACAQVVERGYEGLVDKISASKDVGGRAPRVAQGEAAELDRKRASVAATRGFVALTSHGGPKAAGAKKGRFAQGRLSNALAILPGVAGVEINPEPIRLVGEPELVRGDGRRLSHYRIVLSDEPSRRWRDVFRDAADTDHAVSGYIVLVDGDRVDFEATADILPGRLHRIRAWIDWANAEVGSE